MSAPEVAMSATDPRVPPKVLRRYQEQGVTAATVNKRLRAS